ncbi:MAG TPA: glycoside hydrolase family 2 protein [Vicinamibacterales bacterium]|nr:glycoside hydrolase family 2 protein [Vicinamibacterales bacterium]
MHRIACATAALVALVVSSADAQPAPALTLADGWQIQSSAVVHEAGEMISTPSFRATGWYGTTVPATVLAALVANKVYPDPYFGMNLRSIPGTSYPIGRNFSALPMPDDSPFRVSWWYRVEFRVQTPGPHAALHFDGLNYRANIWLNGRQIGRAADVAGMYRVFEFDVTGTIRSGANVLAVEVFPPQPSDLAWTWVDWNPAPPDKNMGVWRPVRVTTSGDVTIRRPHVVSTVSGTRSADLTVSAELTNLTAASRPATLTGHIGSIAFSQRVDLAPHETRVVAFSPAVFSGLHVVGPRLWWPAQMGAPDRYDLALDAQVGGVVSDRAGLRFGIREITSELTPSGGRLFKINGRPILIRGGGWAPDMLLRPMPARQEAELRYVRDMGLNTIRLEGKLEDEHFFDLADEYGILVLAGWCCCDRWEQWAQWTDDTHAIAAASQHDQICRLRSHPSVLAWMNGSDNPPPADVERVYVDILKKLDWPNPYVSSATAKKTAVTGDTGVKMNGPYDWVPPNYWLEDDSHGGAYGFATEISPGAAVPPVESLRRMLPGDHLWPIDDVWNFHAGGGQFRTIQTFTDAMTRRYGAASSLDDYAAKAQLMAYEGERAMFEAYARNKYTATGVIQWMLNNAWPSMIWHLYDYYLRPGGGYFGTKKACEPVHVQYSYDDRSIVVVNNTAARVTATAVVNVLNLDGSVQFSRSLPVEAGPDAVVRAVVLPDIATVSEVHFLDLRLNTPAGQPLSTNFYWLPVRMDELDWSKSTWYGTPVKSYADLTRLKNLPATKLAWTVAYQRRGAEGEARVTLTNSGSAVALFVRLQVTKGVRGEEVLPVLWQDNYVSLLPGERREISATYRIADLAGAQPAVTVTGWNVR